MRKMTLLSSIGLAAAVAVTGCKKDKKQEKPVEPVAEAPTAEKPTEPTAPPAELPPAAEQPPAETPPPPRPASVTDDQIKVGDDLLAGFTAVAAAAEGAKGDCKAMARALATHALKVRPVMKRAEAIGAQLDKDPAAKEWFKATYKGKTEEQFARLLPAVEPCKDDRSVAAAMKNIGPRKVKVVEPPAEAPSAPADPKTK